MLGKSSIIWSDKEQKEPISPHVISSFSSRFLLLVNRTLNWCLLNWMSGSAEDFVTSNACLSVSVCYTVHKCKSVCVCMCLMLSFKRGNMLSLGIRGSGSLKEPCNTVTSGNTAFIRTMVDYFTQMLMLLIHSEKKRIITTRDGKDPGASVVQPSYCSRSTLPFQEASDEWEAPGHLC